MDRLRQSILQALEDNKLDAIVYPTSRVRPPLVTLGKGIDNAPFAAISALPAITVPAGFTSDGLPIGVELAGRPFGEPVLLQLAYAYEQATHHRRPPASTPPLGSSRASTPPPPIVSSEVGGVAFDTSALGRDASPPSDVPFTAAGHFNFNETTRELGYVIQMQGSSPDFYAGSYLHHRDQGRPNGGVIQILSKGGATVFSGKVTLSNQDVNDLKAGNLYFDVLSKASPRQTARGNLVLPIPAAESPPAGAPGSQAIRPPSTGDAGMR